MYIWEGIHYWSIISISTIAHQLRLPSSDCSKCEWNWMIIKLTGLEHMQASIRHTSKWTCLWHVLWQKKLPAINADQRGVLGRTNTLCPTLMSLACRDLIINDHHYYQLSGSTGTRSAASITISARCGLESAIRIIAILSLWYRIKNASNREWR